MYEHCGLFFLWYPHAMTFLIFLDILALKTFLLHAVYVGFHLSGTLKLLHYALLEIQIYDSQIVHPTFKSFQVILSCIFC